MDRDATADLLSRFIVGLLFAMLSAALLKDFLATGHVTGLFLLASELLVVVFTIVRRRTSLVDRSALAAAVTTLSIVGPPMLRTGGAAALASDSVTACISIVGLSIVIVSKFTLGRSFGLVPANRGVVASGPYRVVRHPIYIGYLITHGGFLIAHPRMSNLLVLAASDVALVWRALMEERVLHEDERYRSYCQRVTWHLVPGVF
jgi:protein-S-isoprenylcysteine O-methyltransferase Ste14